MRFTATSTRRVEVPAPPPAKKWTEMAKNRGRESAGSPSAAATGSPLPPSLKKTPSAFAAKWNAYIEAIGIGKDHHTQQYTHKTTTTAKHSRRSSSHGKEKGTRRVHFPACDEEIGQEFDRPETTDEEKACYHYSKEELEQMMRLGKHLAQQESRFAGLPEDTIYEQGYLTLPANNVFFHHKRYYCLLKGHQLLCYSTPVHAAKHTGLKCHFTILQVQDCQSMNMQKKIALFGANLPQQIGLMLVVTKSNGERVIITTENRLSKRNWLHTLKKLTEVVEGFYPTASEEEEEESSHSPVDKKQRAETPESCDEGGDVQQGSTSSTAQQPAE